MTFALLHRELLVQSRKPGNYWFRVAIAGVGVATLAFFWAMQRLTARQGLPPMPTQVFAAWVLGMLHGCLTLTLAVSGALVTADCLSRERREGTLGLLFLTSLSAGDVAIGKCAGQLLRLGAVW